MSLDQTRGKLPADFIDQQDRVPMQLCFSTYSAIITELEGYQVSLIGSNFARCWVKCPGSVIIGIRGTAIGEPGGFSNLLDDTVIAGLIGKDKCALAIVKDVEKFVQEFIDRNFCEIIVCGHSLGGEASFCLAQKYPQITRSISFNGAAPASGGVFQGAGKEKSTAYHIVGDVVSTHISDDRCTVKRIKLVERYPTNWGDPFYYHSTDRFYYEARKYVFWTAQQEQEDMQDYVYHSTINGEVLSLLLGLVTKYLHRDRLREFICSHPIPGSKANNQCARDMSLGRAGQILGAFAGGLIGLVLGGTAGLAALGVTGAATGLYAGYQLASGQGLLDITGVSDKGAKAAYVAGMLGKTAIEYLQRPR
jgi:hypothetical protein